MDVHTLCLAAAATAVRGQRAAIVAPRYAQIPRVDDIANMIPVELIERVRRTHGDQEIRTVNGGSIRFWSSQSGAHRGCTVDTLCLIRPTEFTEEAVLSVLTAANHGEVLRSDA